MGVRVGERRRSRRGTVCGGVILRNSDGQFLGRCQVTNMSEHGLFVVTANGPGLPSEGRVLVEMALSSGAAPGRGLKTTVYDCRIVRSQQMGNLFGLGLEFGEKIV